MNHDVFISYSSKNSTVAQAICHELEDNGIKCWMASRDITVGLKYASVITDAIINSKVVVLIFSNYSARSVWVESEINIAFSNRKTIIPYKIDTANYEDFKEFYLLLNNRHWIEAYPDYKTRFKELISIVAQILDKDISASKPSEPIQKATSTPLSQWPFSINKKIWWVTTICSIFVGLICWFTMSTYTDPAYITTSNPIYEKRSPASASAPELDQHDESIVMTPKIEKKEMMKDNSYLLNLPDDNFVKFSINNKYGFRLKSSGIVISLKYDYVYPFREGLAAVKLKGKWGYVDKADSVVIPFIYDEAFSFDEGKAYVELNNEYFYIDKKGNRIK